MSFVVEDGTGLEDSTTYATVDYADDYFSTRGITAWQGTGSEKEAALIRATDYIEKRWSLRFMGMRVDTQTPQALSFPRRNLVDRTGVRVTGIPENLKKATCEYAVRALTTVLDPDAETSPSGLVVVGKREKVGPLEEETQYQTSSGGLMVALQPYPAADRLLAPYLLPAGINYR